MAKAIFILGLCGSGKTNLANEIKKQNQAVIYDEGLLSDKFESIYKSILENLRHDVDCVIVEINLCTKEAREFLLLKLNQDLPNTEKIWKCFENNIEKANKNVIKRAKKGEKTDIEGHKRINEEISPTYSYPKDAEILSIETDWE